MPSWIEIKNELAVRFSVLEADEHFLALQLMGGGRRQTVMVSFSEGDQGPSWVRLESGFASVTGAALSTAVEYVGMDENVGVGIGRLGDILVIRWSSPIDGLPIDVLSRMIDGVAGHADRLEAATSGGRDIF
jgi:hypothetical protein